MMLVLCFGLISCDKDDDKNEAKSLLIGTWREPHHPTEVGEITFNKDNSGVYLLIETSSGKDVISERKPFTYDFNEETMVINMVLRCCDDVNHNETFLWKADVISLSNDKLILKYTFNGVPDKESVIYNRKK